MVTLLLSLFAFLLVAGGLFTLGSLILAGIGVYALWRLTIWSLRGLLFGATSCRRHAGGRPEPRGPFVARYHRPPTPPHRPQPQVVAVSAGRPANARSCSRGKRGMPSWSQLAIGLVFFALVALGFRAKELVTDEGLTPPAQAKPRATAKKVKGGRALPAPSPPPAVEARDDTPAPPDASWTVTAAGGSLESARQKALKEAYDDFLQYLRNQNPPIEWKPSSPEFVRKHLKTEWKDEKITQDDQSLDDLQKVDRIYQVTLSVEVLPKHREEILKLDQRFHAEQRLLWLAQIVGCLIALLAAIAGYVRLDEWTKGYYSGWLRLAAVGFIGAAGAGLWTLLAR
jgi:hypothetical protein